MYDATYKKIALDFISILHAILRKVVELDNEYFVRGFFEWKNLFEKKKKKKKIQENSSKNTSVEKNE